MMLSIQNLSKTYSNGVIALDQIQLEIRSGMFGLLGPNGAGKSTLMRTLATLQTADGGSMNLNGIDIDKEPIKLRRTLGYLPQSFGVYPRESAENLLDYFALLKGITSRRQRKIKVSEVLHLTNLYEVRKNHVSSYSGGMRQRFGIAQLLLNDPQLIIVDEPTAGLDPAERKRFLSVLRGLGTENVVLFSTHLVEDVNELCTDMAIMNRGKILMKSTPAQAINDLVGKIWTRRIQANELHHYQAEYSYLSSSYNTDHSLNVRIFSANKPGPFFEIPDHLSLEDVYFNALRENVASHA